jgi:hypothetical protein
MQCLGLMQIHSQCMHASPCVCGVAMLPQWPAQAQVTSLDSACPRGWLCLPQRHIPSITNLCLLINSDIPRCVFMKGDTGCRGGVPHAAQQSAAGGLTAPPQRSTIVT